MGTVTIALIAAFAGFVIGVLIDSDDREAEKKLFHDSADEAFKVAFECKCECNRYKERYEVMCEKYIEVMNKYVALYKQKGE